MRTGVPELPLFRSRLQADLLTALFARVEEGVTVTDLVLRTSGNRSSVQRELARLLDAGILERDHVGRSSVYRIADSPLKRPLGELIERSIGVVPQLAEQLSRIDGVEAAAVFGSWASTETTPESDIDLLVVGSAQYSVVIAAISDIERRAGREVDARVYDRPDFRRRVAEGSGFLQTVLSGPLIGLVGDIREAAR